jgi:hypothetical protein
VLSGRVATMLPVATTPSRDRPIFAHCSNPACGQTFVAGTAGPTGMKVGGPGSAAYIGQMTTHASGVTVAGAQVSCPACGSMGNIADGTYQYLRDGYRILRSITPLEARTLIESLQAYQDGKAGAAEVVESTPLMAKGFVEGSLRGADGKYWAGILIMLMIYLRQKVQADQSTREIESRFDRQIERVVEQNRDLAEQVRELLDQSPFGRSERAPRAKPPPTSAKPPAQLPNKNDPCWCGSGRRFQRCHRKA